jgi:hypothetical protein
LKKGNVPSDGEISNPSKTLENAIMKSKELSLKYSKLEEKKCVL